MDDENSLIKQRREKLEALQAKGIQPFMNKFTPDRGCGEARAGLKAWFDAKQTDPATTVGLPEGTAVKIAGRITAHRDMGKSQFLDLKDVSGRIQLYAQKQALGDDQFEIFRHLDLADFIGVEGTLFMTRAGEPSLKVEKFTILGKALRPPPAKWEGLADTEIRYRQRYLDLIANDDVKSVFLKRSAIVREIRAFFHERGYVEVETPVMQAIPGGAAAQPFITKHNALGCDFYLRIALELYHKRLLVGGVDRLFEIGKNFRNEGLSRRHNPEFTMLEAYQAFGDYETMMETVESLVKRVAERVLGTLEIEHFDKTAFGEIAARLRSRWTNLRSRLTGDQPRQPSVVAAFEQITGPYAELFGDELEPSCANARKLLETIPALLGVLKLDADSSQPRLIWTQSLRSTVFESTDEEFSFQADLKGLEALVAKTKVINLTSWRRVRYKDLLRERIRADWFELTREQRLAYAEGALGVEVAGRPQRKFSETIQQHQEAMSRIGSYLKAGMTFDQLAEADRGQFNQAMDEYARRGEYLEHGVEDFEVSQAVFEKLIEPTLINPTFVTHVPKELVPLAKLSPDDPTTVEVFECCINGQEISPGYTEQNDPIAQRDVLEHQAGGEQQKLDEDFLVALEHGMPPAGGIGIGIDRLCMMLLGQESIRDVILFPQLKPKA
jgi:lysyl-tRNA synthetase class II